jgi:hypothetical protein
MKVTKRKNIRKVPLSSVVIGSGVCIITMSIGQWDETLRAAYDCGYVLLELDDNEQPVAAYKRPDLESN